MAFEHIPAAISQRQKQGLLRKLVTIKQGDDSVIQVAGKEYVNFSGNDYLGMSQHPQVLKAFAESSAAGAGASPVVTGYSEKHQALCEYLAELTGQEAVMLFNSGFAANHAICQTLFDGKPAAKINSGLILGDKLCHASIIDGALSSSASFKRFAHNDLEHLHTLLDSSQGQGQKDILVVSEGIFSMDGDSAPINELLDISHRNQAWLMLDYAHAIGCQPASELFYSESNGNKRKPEIVMATFGKAVGTGGAFVAASQEVICFLQNFARHFVYSTAFSAAHALATLRSLQCIEMEPWRRETLNSNIRYFKRSCAELNIPLMPSDSAIQPVMVGEPHAALNLSESLKANGYWVTAIRYPTVPKNTDRLRITLTANHTRQDLDSLLDALHLTFRGAINEAGQVAT